MVEKIKNYFKTRGVGFYISIAAFVILIYCLIAYNPFFKGGSYYEPATITVLAIGVTIVALLIIGGVVIEGLNIFVPGAIAATSWIAFLFFFKGIWMMVQDAVGGYEFLGMSNQFYAFIIPVLVCCVASLVAFFGFPFKKKEA